MIRAKWLGSPPRDEIGDAEQRSLILSALAELPARQRAAVVLSELLGYGSEEVGHLMGIRPGTVRVLASQARSALRHRLGGEI